MQILNHWLACTWDWITNRLKEFSSQFALLDAAVIAALSASNGMSGHAEKIMFAMVFLKVVTPEWSRK